MDEVGPDVPAPLAVMRQALHETFLGEVDARLPRLASLVAGDDVEIDQARRDAHSLASSAVIVEEPEIARLAQAVELDPVHGPVSDLVAALSALRQRATS